MKKRIIAFLIIIGLGLKTVSVYAANNNSNSGDNVIAIADKVDADGKEYLFDPETNEYLPINHIEGEIALITERNGHDYEFERLFEEKREQEAAKAKQFSRDNETSDPPVPGGVGYGAYYTSTFQNDFTTGTTLFYNIICPTVAGGDVSNYLYLTSTNRAAKGVEAFISYYSQNNLQFKVFDWARYPSAPWQVTLNYSDLSDYLEDLTIQGAYRQSVTVYNRTVQTSSTQWTNVVWLKNYTTNSFDQIYIYTYDATLSDQRDSHYGSWGPIVETFQDYYYMDTNIIGFYYIQLSSKNTAYNNSTWENLELLTVSKSNMTSASFGFEVVFKAPNSTYAVH